MSSRRILVLCFLAAWVFLGPVAMAFEGCAAMGAMCEGPCGVSSCTIFTPALWVAPAPTASLYAAVDQHLPANASAGLERPPKSIPRSA
jgi:hypothetical protein